MPKSILTEICVERLFNKFTYNLPQNDKLSSPAILYGDNGAGKSTILRLVFHLLSAHGNRGHRTALKNTAFKSISVKLSTGEIIKAARQDRTDDPDFDYSFGALRLTIERGDKVISEWIFNQDRDEGSHVVTSSISAADFAEFLNISEMDLAKISVRDLESLSSKIRRRTPVRDGVLRGQRPYLETLQDVAPTVFFVNAERRLDSDAVADPSDELELRRAITLSETKRINDVVRRAREIALTQAISAASHWVQRRAVQSAIQGSTNVHSVYADVLQHLSNDYIRRRKKKETTFNIRSLTKQLDDIEIRTKQLEQYELATALDMSVFKNAINSPIHAQQELSADLIAPYIRSVISRLDALNQTYMEIDRFVKNINGFLTGKELTYKQTQGFLIVTPEKRLEASQLSSGEQQLILMFCYALTARDRPSVFMIDEPEISLNVKWQRKLLQALAEITSGSEIQFIMASHSLELIAQHRNRVVRMEARQ